MQVKTPKFLVLKFYFDTYKNYRHSSSAVLEFYEAAGLVKNDKPPITLAMVDCEKNRITRDSFFIDCYPTMKVFRNGSKVHEYSGSRQAKDIVEYMRAEVS